MTNPRTTADSHAATLPAPRLHLVEAGDLTGDLASELTADGLAAIAALRAAGVTTALVLVLRPEREPAVMDRLVGDVAAGIAIADGELLVLSPLLLRLLAYLTQRRGRVVAREELLLALWPAGARPNTVDVAMGRLGRRLSESPSGTRIRRVHGRGWVLVSS